MVCVVVLLNCECIIADGTRYRHRIGAKTNFRYILRTNYYVPANSNRVITITCFFAVQ
jgi:hypothetical protein